jgi:hypothetical protein
VLGHVLGLAGRHVGPCRRGDAALNIPHELTRWPPRLVAPIVEAARQRLDHTGAPDDVVVVWCRVYIAFPVVQVLAIVADQMLQHVWILWFLSGGGNLALREGCGCELRDGKALEIG